MQKRDIKPGGKVISLTLFNELRQSPIELAKAILNDHEISYTHLARKIGIGRTTLWRYKKGRGLTRLKAMAIINTVLGDYPEIGMVYQEVEQGNVTDQSSGVSAPEHLSSPNESITTQLLTEKTGIITSMSWHPRSNRTICRVQLQALDREVPIAFVGDVSLKVFKGDTVKIRFILNGQALQNVETLLLPTEKVQA